MNQKSPSVPATAVEEVKLYSERLRHIYNESITRYSYNFDRELKYKILYIFENLFEYLAENNCCEGSRETLEEGVYQKARKFLCRRYGRPRLSAADGAKTQVADFFIDTDCPAYCFDIIELLFKLAADLPQKSQLPWQALSYILDYSAEELNKVFDEHLSGYRFEQGRVIRLNSGLIHRQTMQPVLQLLADNRFADADDDFFRAHHYYRLNAYGPCVIWCCRSFETTLRILCDIRNYEKDAVRACGSAADLIELIDRYEVMPECVKKMLRQSVDLAGTFSLPKMSCGGLPAVDENTAGFVLHITAANINYLARQAELFAGRND
jgi:hypothetical protein